MPLYTFLCSYTFCLSNILAVSVLKCHSIGSLSMSLLLFQQNTFSELFHKQFTPPFLRHSLYWPLIPSCDNSHSVYWTIPFIDHSSPHGRWQLTLGLLHYPVYWPTAFSRIRGDSETSQIRSYITVYDYSAVVAVSGGAVAMLLLVVVLLLLPWCCWPLPPCYHAVMWQTTDVTCCCYDDVASMHASAFWSLCSGLHLCYSTPVDIKKTMVTLRIYQIQNKGKGT